MKAEDPAFVEFLQTLQRPINCIIDEVHNKVEHRIGTHDSKD